MKKSLKKFGRWLGSSKGGVWINVLVAVYYIGLAIFERNWAYAAVSTGFLVAASWAYQCHIRERITEIYKMNARFYEMLFLTTMEAVKVRDDLGPGTGSDGTVPDTGETEVPRP